MKAEDAIGRIEAAVYDLKKQKQDIVSTDALLVYLGTIKNEVAASQEIDAKKFESDLAVFRAQHEQFLAQYDERKQFSLEMLRSVIAYGQAALKSAILINGGAAVALLAFIGNIWTKGIEHSAVLFLTKAIASFTYGVLAAAIAIGATYFTQYCYSEHWNRAGIHFHVLTIILGISAYVFFWNGSVDAYSAFVNHLSTK